MKLSPMAAMPQMSNPLAARARLSLELKAGRSRRPASMCPPNHSTGAATHSAA
jgi:hypothetical protein